MACRDDHKTHVRKTRFDQKSSSSSPSLGCHEPTGRFPLLQDSLSSKPCFNNSSADVRSEILVVSSSSSQKTVEDKLTPTQQQIRNILLQTYPQRNRDGDIQSITACLEDAQLLVKFYNLHGDDMATIMTLWQWCPWFLRVLKLALLYRQLPRDSELGKPPSFTELIAEDVLSALEGLMQVVDNDPKNKLVGIHRCPQCYFPNREIMDDYFRDRVFVQNVLSVASARRILAPLIYQVLHNNPVRKNNRFLYNGILDTIVVDCLRRKDDPKGRKRLWDVLRQLVVYSSEGLMDRLFSRDTPSSVFANELVPLLVDEFYLHDSLEPPEIAIWFLSRFRNEVDILNRRSYIRFLANNSLPQSEVRRSEGSAKEGLFFLPLLLSFYNADRVPFALLPSIDCLRLICSIVKACDSAKFLWSIDLNLLMFCCKTFVGVASDNDRAIQILWIMDTMFIKYHMVICNGLENTRHSFEGNIDISFENIIKSNPLLMHRVLNVIVTSAKVWKTKLQGEQEVISFDLLTKLVHISSINSFIGARDGLRDSVMRLLDIIIEVKPQRMFTGWFIGPVAEIFPHNGVQSNTDAIDTNNQILSDLPLQQPDWIEITTLDKDALQEVLKFLHTKHSKIDDVLTERLLVQLKDKITEHMLSNSSYYLNTTNDAKENAIVGLLSRLFQLQILRIRALQPDAAIERNIVKLSIEIVHTLVMSTMNPEIYVPFCKQQQQLLSYLLRLWMRFSERCHCLDDAGLGVLKTLVEIFQALASLRTREYLGSKKVGLLSFLVHMVCDETQSRGSSEFSRLQFIMSQLLNALLYNDKNKRLVGDASDCLEVLVTRLSFPLSIGGYSSYGSSDMTYSSGDASIDLASMCSTQQTLSSIDFIQLQILYTLWSLVIDDSNKVALTNPNLSILLKLARLLRNQEGNPSDSTVIAALGILSEMTSSQESITWLMSQPSYVVELLHVMLYYCKPNVMDWTIDFLSILCNLVSHLLHPKCNLQQYSSLISFFVTNAFNSSEYEIGSSTEGIVSKLIYGLTKHINDRVLELSTQLLMMLCQLLSQYGMSKEENVVNIHGCDGHRSILYEWIGQKGTESAVLIEVVNVLLSSKVMNSYISETTRLHSLQCVVLISSVLKGRGIEQILSISSSCPSFVEGSNGIRKHGRPSKNGVETKSFVVETILHVADEELCIVLNGDESDQFEGSTFRIAWESVVACVDIYYNLASKAKKLFVTFIPRCFQFLIKLFRFFTDPWAPIPKQGNEWNPTIEGSLMKLLYLMRLSPLDESQQMLQPIVDDVMENGNFISIRVQCLLIMGNVAKWRYKSADTGNKRKKSRSISQKLKRGFNEKFHELMQELMENLTASANGDDVDRLKYLLMSLRDVLLIPLQCDCFRSIGTDDELKRVLRKFSYQKEDGPVDWILKFMDKLNSDGILTVLAKSSLLALNVDLWTMFVDIVVTVVTLQPLRNFKSSNADELAMAFSVLSKFHESDMQLDMLMCCKLLELKLTTSYTKPYIMQPLIYCSENFHQTLLSFCSLFLTFDHSIAAENEITIWFWCEFIVLSWYSIIESAVGVQQLDQEQCLAVTMKVLTLQISRIMSKDTAAQLCYQTICAIHGLSIMNYLDLGFQTIKRTMTPVLAKSENADKSLGDVIPQLSDQLHVLHFDMTQLMHSIEGDRDSDITELKEMEETMVQCLNNLQILQSHLERDMECFRDIEVSEEEATMEELSQEMLFVHNQEVLDDATVTTETVLCTPDTILSPDERTDPGPQHPPAIVSPLLVSSISSLDPIVQDSLVKVKWDDAFPPQLYSCASWSPIALIPNEVSPAFDCMGSVTIYPPLFVPIPTSNDCYVANFINDNHGICSPG